MTLIVGVLFFGLLLFFIWRKERRQPWKTADAQIKSAIVEPVPVLRKAAEQYARVNGSYPRGWETYAALHSKWSQ